MSTPRIWSREATKEDAGFLHPGSLERFRGDSYAKTALNADTIETENYWALSMFHGPSFSESLLKEIYRPNIRTSLAVGTTNYMTQSRDHNRKKIGTSIETFNEVICSISDHHLFDKSVAVMLGYMIVQNELTEYLDPDFEYEHPEIFEAVSHFESVSKGAQNGDFWTGKVKLHVPRYKVIRYLGKKKSEFYKLEATLKEICRDLFGSAEGIL